MIARMNPRDPVKAMDRILNACTRPTLANAATYSYSRGGSDITGPTIRLAEAIAQGWDKHPVRHPRNLAGQERIDGRILRMGR